LTAPVAGSGENLNYHSAQASRADKRANNFKQVEAAETSPSSVVSHATASGTEQTSGAAAPGGSKQTLERSAPSASSRSAAQETVSSATPLATVQPASADAAAAGLRTPAAHTSAAWTSGHAPSAASASSPASAQDTFTALDRESSLGTPAWTHAGGQHAEAGFQDPDLGWVGVRADLNTSGIHATLVPSSADAAQSLSGHLAGLGSHLAEQQTSVASLSMASPDGTGAETAMGQQMQQGTQGDAQGSAQQSAPSGSRENTASSAAAQAAAEDDGAGSTMRAAEMSGTHISVMA
jgi:hypothetical protein